MSDNVENLLLRHVPAAPGEDATPFLGGENSLPGEGMEEMMLQKPGRPLLEFLVTLAAELGHEDRRLREEFPETHEKRDDLVIPFDQVFVKRIACGQAIDTPPAGRYCVQIEHIGLGDLNTIPEGRAGQPLLSMVYGIGRNVNTETFGLRQRAHAEEEFEVSTAQIEDPGQSVSL